MRTSPFFSLREMAEAFFGLAQLAIACTASFQHGYASERFRTWDRSRILFCSLCYPPLSSTHGISALCRKTPPVQVGMHSSSRAELYPPLWRSTELIPRPSKFPRGIFLGSLPRPKQTPAGREYFSYIGGGPFCSVLLTLCLLASLSLSPSPLR